MKRLSPEKRSEDAAVGGEARMASLTKKERAEMGRKGGMIGGASRAAKLTPEQRKAIAKKAAGARWAKKSK